MNALNPKTVQVDYDLFLSMIKYISCHTDKEDPLWKAIESGISMKVDALARRALYTAYKTAPSMEARELARQEYLDMLGIPESFRWSTSQDVNVMHPEDF